jgi:alpha-glucoside transport system permease protein
MGLEGGGDMVPKIMKQGRLAPWLYLAPALLLMTVFIIYPTLSTMRLSLLDAHSVNSATTECIQGQPCWGIFENYRYALTNHDMLIALRNNALWLLLMLPGTIAGGLFFAVLADRVRYESVAKSILFMPMAISFVGASIIWRFVYAIESGSQVQIGLLNAILVKLGAQPVAWLSNPSINNFSLMLVGVWLWAGFCMTILSAAIKGVSVEILEASRVDGANEWNVFWKIMFPSILPTIVVVTTTMAVIILKIFDVVFVMTGGYFGTEVIANRMFKLIVTNTGQSTAIAVILIALTIPIMIFNVRRFRKEEANR